MNTNVSMESSMHQMHRLVQEKEENRIEKHRQVLPYLILDYLHQNRLTETSNMLIREASLSSNIRISDNIDLEMILMSHDNYYQMKFNRYPMLYRRIETTADVTKKTTISKNITKPKDPVKKITTQQETNDCPADDIHLAMTVTPIAPNENTDKVSSIEKPDLPKERSMQLRISKCIEKLYPADSELRKIAEDVSKEIVLNDLNIHWNDVVGLKDCKTAIEEAIVYPLRYPIFFSGPFSPWKAILLYGPPGTGKTMLAKAVATECNCTFFNITASSLVSKWRGESEKYIRVLFDLACSLSPTIIFTDEIDWIATKVENDSLSEPAKRFRSELLAKLDGLVSTENSNVILLAATNAPSDIDAALLRRLEKRIYVPLPDEVTRFGIFKLYLSDQILTDKIKMQQIIKSTERYSCADIKLICKQAWILEATSTWKKLDKKEISLVNLQYNITNFELLQHAINCTERTVASEKIYCIWAKNNSVNKDYYNKRSDNT